MKRVRVYFILAALAFSAFGLRTAVAADFESGSTGADGALSPIVNTVLQVPSDGVFNFTTVNIPNGVVVTFDKNTSNSPITILASGNVTVAGIINASGFDSTSGVTPGEGGPGGYDGGWGGPDKSSGGAGLGPGGGAQGIYNSGSSVPAIGGAGAGFSSNGSNGGSAYGIVTSGGSAYGNTKIMPLIGGSGGGGGGGALANNNIGYNSGGGGGGGGGGLLIASSGTINVTGAVYADGGDGCCKSSGTVSVSASGGGGSGGAIRLVANTITGSGFVAARKGAKGTAASPGGDGSDGRIRLEAYQISLTKVTSPSFISGPPSSVFAQNLPTLRISSIGGATVQTSPAGEYGSPDIRLPVDAANPISVVVEATNITPGTVVKISAIPYNGTPVLAEIALTGSLSSSSATAQLDLLQDYEYIVGAYTSTPVQTALYYEGERIQSVRLGTEGTVYVTDSGREIQGEILMASLSQR